MWTYEPTQRLNSTPSKVGTDVLEKIILKVRSHKPVKSITSVLIIVNLPYLC